MMQSNLQLASLVRFSFAAATPAAAQVPETVQRPPVVITRKLPPSADFWVRVVYVGDLNLKFAAGQQEMEKRGRQGGGGHMRDPDAAAVLQGKNGEALPRRGLGERPPADGQFRADGAIVAHSEKDQAGPRGGAHLIPCPIPRDERRN
jgi:hypothetical protein